MRPLNGRYAQGSIAAGRSGHLFQDRYWSELIWSDRHLLALAAYIEMNPSRRACERRRSGDGERGAVGRTARRYQQCAKALAGPCGNVVLALVGAALLVGVLSSLARRWAIVFSRRWRGTRRAADGGVRAAREPRPARYARHRRRERTSSTGVSVLTDASMTSSARLPALGDDRQRVVTIFSANDFLRQHHLVDDLLDEA
jgi:hypothetical protein